MELYNKYRPKTVSEIRGNELAIKSIQSEISNGSHCFLITGNSGCGKTTLARAVALDMGCDDFSIHEINASDDRGIEAMRKIKEEIRFAPFSGNAVYILDECHSITPAAQESILKMLEECPEYCYFMLCTTDPGKLIPTIKNRCSRIQMEPLSQTELFKLLRIVAHKEGRKIDPDVLNKIASSSEGSSRMALKTLGSVLFLETDEERKQYLEHTTFDEENPDAIELCRSLFKTEGFKRYSECLTKLDKELETSAEGVRHLVMKYAISVLKKGWNPQAAAMLQVFSQADTYRNKGKAIWVAVLDFMEFISQNPASS